MLVFWLSVAVLCVLTLWALWRPLHSQSALKMESVQQRNIAIARERALEIDSAFEAGDLSETEYAQAKQDLEVALADELASSKELSDQFRSTPKASHYAILALVPLLAYGSYMLTSNFRPDGAETRQQAENGAAPPFEELLAGLEEKVKANPEDQPGIYLLAQSYARMGRYAESAEQFKRLIAIAEPSADLYAGLADVQAMAANRQFNQEISDTLDKALELDPQHISALWLSGLAKQQLGDPETALRRWLTLKPILPDNAEARQELAILINNVNDQLGEKAAQIQAEFEQPAGRKTKTDTKVGLTVKVSLDPALQSAVNSGDIVFVYAKAKSGPPMPLAAVRQPVSSLPFSVTLDDSMAMLPNMKLSSFAEVLVGARISASGQALEQPGDHVSESIATTNTNPDTIELVINKRVP